jgi:hypothetical protein
MNPAGGTISRLDHIASQVLPAAGAFLTPAWQPIPKGTTRVTYWVTYTRGAAGGFPRFEAHVSNGVDDAREIIQDDSTLATAQPNGRISMLLEQLDGPQPDDGSAITYRLTYERIEASVTQVRLRSPRPAWSPPRARRSRLRATSSLTVPGSV